MVSYASHHQLPVVYISCKHGQAHIKHVLFPLLYFVCQGDLCQLFLAWLVLWLNQSLWYSFFKDVGNLEMKINWCLYLYTGKKKFNCFNFAFQLVLFFSPWNKWNGISLQGANTWLAATSALPGNKGPQTDSTGTLLLIFRG